MAASWPLTPSVRSAPTPTGSGRSSTVGALRASATEHVNAAVRTSPALARAVEIARSPVTALVVIVLGLVLLFAMPLLGLPFLALVVLPAVVHHLRAEHRPHLPGAEPRR